jgi:hypothetical protein
MVEMLSKLVGIVKSHNMIGANAQVLASHYVMPLLSGRWISPLGGAGEDEVALHSKLQ